MGLERCRQFLAKKNPHAARRAGQAIALRLAQLESDPNLGRPFAGAPELRELLITFGDSGYVGLYRYESETDIVLLLAFRQKKEAGY